MKLERTQRRKLSERKSCPDPVMTNQFPHSQPDVFSEKLRKIVKQFCKKDLDKAVVDQDVFMATINKKIVQSMADPGEAVGLLCAQSVGEPSTQMTLNTFHFAGRGEMNVTLGIPRLVEILMVGSKMPKTPQIDVPIRDGPDAMKMAEKLRAELTTVTFNQVLEHMDFNVNLVTSNNCNYKEVQVKFKCLHHSQYQETCSMKFNSIINYVVSKFIPTLEAAVKKENKILNLSSLFTSGKLKKTTSSPAAAKSRSGDGDLDDPNDGDSSVMKEQLRRKDTVEYEGDEEIEEVYGVGMEGSDDDEIADEESESENQEQKVEPKTSTKENEFKLKALAYNSVTAMTFGGKKKRSFTLTFRFAPQDIQFDLRFMFEKLVKSCVIQQVPGITRAFISKEVENGKTVHHLKTEGINIQYLLKYPYILDLNRLHCNSIHHMLQFYGVEAANRAIIKEVKSVFGAYGIAVDFHHLSLLADYMTSRGEYDAFNRMHIDKAQTSMLQKITFETSMNFLLGACVNSEKDHLKSPSGQMIVGKPVTIGTGCFDVLLK